MLAKRQAPRIDAILFCTLFVLLIYEQFNFGHPLLSVYKVIIFPLTLLGSYRLSRFGPRNGAIVSVFIVVGIVYFLNMVAQRNYQGFVLPISITLTAYYFSAYCYVYRIPRYFNWAVLYSAVPQILVYLVVRKYYFEWAYDNQFNSTRFKGFATDPNFMCFMLTASIIAGGLVCLHWKRYALFRSGPFNLLSILFACIVSFACGYIILQSGSRTGTIFIVLGIYMVAASSFGYIKLGLAGLVAGALSYGLLRQLLSFVSFGDSDSAIGQVLWRFKLLIEGNPNKMFDYGDYAFNDSRAYLWERAWQYLKEDLFIGHSRLWFKYDVGKRSHNSYIDFMLDCGSLVGGLFLLGLLIIVVRLVFTMAFNPRRINPDYSFIVAYMPIYLLGLMFFSLSTPKFTWLMIVFLLIINRELSQRQNFAPEARHY